MLSLMFVVAGESGDSSCLVSRVPCFAFGFSRVVATVSAISVSSVLP